MICSQLCSETGRPPARALLSAMIAKASMCGPSGQVRRVKLGSRCQGSSVIRRSSAAIAVLATFAGHYRGAKRPYIPG